MAFTHYAGVCYLKEAEANRVICTNCTSGALVPPPNATLPAKWPMAGVTFTGGRYCPNVSVASAASLRRLASTGATWVSLVVTQYQHSVNATSIFPLYDGRAVPDPGGYYEFVTIGEAALRDAIRTARSLGLKVMLKPHVDLLYTGCKEGYARCSPGHNGLYWRGDIGGCYPQDAFDAPFGEREWGAWFASYEAFLLPYAALAEEEGVDMLSVNCELYCPNRQEARWRRVVAAVRGAYSGLLTLSAISGFEGEVTWWDALDVIGSDAYYDHGGATTEAQLVASWQRPLAALAALAGRFGKPFAFTEVGMCSGQCSRSHRPSLADYEWQATQYAAVFRATESQPAFLGAFWWNWDSDPGAFDADDCLTPQGKPAELVLRRFYRATQPMPPFLGTASCVGLGRCTC